MSNEERTFLHDIASPLAVADARVRSILRKATQGKFNDDPTGLQTGLQDLIKDIEKITAKLHERREVLMAQDKNTSGKSDGTSK
jgi:hypothetical protein